MNIPEPQDYSARLAARYQPIAGPFSTAREEARILEALQARLTASGCRTLVVREERGGRHGLTLFRLRSECETMEETMRRQKN